MLRILAVVEAKSKIFHVQIRSQCTERLNGYRFTEVLERYLDHFRKTAQ